MPDCPPNNADCLPAGSNAADPCSPCFEPTCDNFLQVLAELSRQVCATGNMIKGWNQKLDKFRNRMDRLEDTINNLPGAEDSVVSGPCQNADSASDGFDSLLGCDDGNPSIISATGEDEEDQFEVVACNGKWHRQPKGLTRHWLDPEVTLAVSNGVNSVTLPSFPEDVCGPIRAIFGTYLSTSAGPSGTPGSTTITVGSKQVAQSGIFGSATYQEATAPVTSSTVTITISVSNAISSSQTMKLLGYEY